MFKNSVLKPDIDTVKWFKAAGIRAVKTMSQTAIATIGSAAFLGAVDWQMVASASALARGAVCADQYCRNSGSDRVNDLCEIAHRLRYVMSKSNTGEKSFQGMIWTPHRFHDSSAKCRAFFDARN